MERTFDPCCFPALHECFKDSKPYLPPAAQADEGKDLSGGIGWSCVTCGACYAKRADAEVCCPDEAVETDTAVVSWPAGCDPLRSHLLM